MKTQLMDAGRLTTMLGELGDVDEVVLDEVNYDGSGKTVVYGTAELDGVLWGFSVAHGTEQGDVILGSLEVTLCEA